MRHLVIAGPAFLLAISAAGIGHGGGTKPRLALVEAPGLCARVPERLPAGAAVGSGELAAFDFLNPNVGVGLTAGEVYCQENKAAPQPSGRALPVRLVVTTDAGHHWEVEGAASPPGSRSGAWPVAPAQPLLVAKGARMPAELAFSSRRTGWAELAGELSFTDDGGRSWQMAHLGGPVVWLGEVGGGALAVTSGMWQLWRTSGVAGSWSAVSRIPVAPRATQADVAAGPAPSDAVVATSHYGDTPPLIAETSNGGKTWQKVQDPLTVGRPIGLP